MANGIDAVRTDINQVLSEMRALKSRAQGFEPATAARDVGQDGLSSAAISDPSKPDFQAILGSAINQVNDVQKQSGALAQSFQMGDPEVTLTQVVVASEKAGVAFEAMSEVRNRLVNAYEDIMNMPI